MFTSQYISIQEFSEASGLEVNLIREFADFGLLTLYIEQEQECLSASDIAHVQRLIRLHNDLGINKEGIEIILSMRDQLAKLRNELKTYQHKAHRLEEELHARFVASPHRGIYIIDLDE